MENFPEFVAIFLMLHNEYRAIHGSPPLQIDDQLNEPAQEWADTLAFTQMIEYRSDPELGENIYVTSSRIFPHEIKPRDPLEHWYREGRYFTYGEEDVKGAEHVRQFTQLIWKETTFIGLGVAADYDGKIYFVCVYYPPGNVVGGFVDNVLPPPEMHDEMLPHEAEGIRTIDPKPDAVRSMERIYSVPSEKLRVWSIWVEKVGEIADEWQRWLRAHIDLSIRLSEQLIAVREALTRDKEEVSGMLGMDEELRIMLETERTDTITMGTMEGQEDDGVDREEEEDVAVEDEIVPEETEEVEEAIDIAKESEEELEESDEQSDWQSWPLGTPWKHYGIEDPDTTPPFEKLPLPTSEEEMKQFLKKFTHEATIFRSYYKHWKETADKAISEVTSRSVLATYIVQGKDAKGEVKKKPCPPKPQPKKTVKRKKKKVKRVSHDGFYTPLGSAAEVPAAGDGEPEPAPAPEEAPAEEATDEEEATTPSVSQSSKMKVTPKKEKSKSKQALTVTVDDLVRNCARAMEPVPYMFYTKAEPDIDIAIEHDDEVVIEEDTDREKVIANFKRTFYNLTDKPCKGGKPWL